MALLCVAQRSRGLACYSLSIFHRKFRIAEFLNRLFASNGYISAD